MTLAITGAGRVVPPAGAAPAWPQGVATVPEPVRARAARAERTTQLVLPAAAAALGAAGLLATQGAPRPRMGLVLGTAFGCFLTNAAYARRLVAAGPAAASPRLFAATVSNAAAGELAIAYRLGGPSITVSAGGASGLVALAHAADVLAAGRADAVLAGGTDAAGEPLAAWLADADLAADARHAEAAAVVVLEPLDAAAARRATVLGTLEGTGVGFEPAPRDAGAGEGLAAAVARACAAAGIAARDAALVVAAAPPPLAPLERRVLGDAVRTLRPKEALGETFGAAGVLGLLAALDALAAGARALVLDVCPSGHVAAAVVGAGARP
ncbi:MAG TPA: beta-ketoacyl synthase N-terminal-like domain-containing protein [Candidatus Binatia bacterium]|nr:beta-ketoacyl synthase N-terminal-like domain-containing protein [Candidatus Binatia bacterium]